MQLKHITVVFYKNIILILIFKKYVIYVFKCAYDNKKNTINVVYIIVNTKIIISIIFT